MSDEDCRYNAFMLLRFRFSNFGSFRSQQELSLAATGASERADTLIPISQFPEKGLRSAAIYGANASGKTTVLRALRYMAMAVKNSHRLWEPDKPIPTHPFRGSPENSISEFEMDFILSGVRYQYSFALDAAAVANEQLVAFPNAKKQTWFRRGQGTVLSFGRNLAGENKTIAGLTRRNSLFLSAAAQNNHEMLSPIYNWFARDLSFFIGERSHLDPETLHACAGESRTDITELLTVADLGIADVNVQKREPDEVSREKTRKLIEAITSIFELKDTPETDIPPTIQFLHRIGDVVVPFDADEESNGTVAYLSLLGPITNALKSGGVLAIDELDRSLHPLIARHIVKLFNSGTTNAKSAQLIFNTHDTTLLRGGLLRRDQIWFTEKDRAGESHLYPLTDFQPRKDENLGTGYLLGRYGAIPFMRDPAVASLEPVDAEAL